jgi:hypothetical protein
MRDPTGTHRQTDEGFRGEVELLWARHERERPEDDDGKNVDGDDEREDGVRLDAADRCDSLLEQLLLLSESQGRQLGRRQVMRAEETRMNGTDPSGG